MCSKQTLPKKPHHNPTSPTCTGALRTGNRWKMDRNFAMPFKNMHNADRFREMVESLWFLTFMKAFFSKAFIITGGIAVWENKCIKIKYKENTLLISYFTTLCCCEWEVIQNKKQKHFFTLQKIYKSIPMAGTAMPIRDTTTCTMACWAALVDSPRRLPSASVIGIPYFSSLYKH